MQLENFGKLVRERLEELGETPFSIERKFGFSSDYVRSVVREDSKRAVPNIDKARRIAEAIGLEFYVGAPREDRPIQDAVIDNRMFAAIPYYNTELAAGDGRIASDNIAPSFLSFSREWLTRKGLTVSNSYLLKVVGDSMEPTLMNGDVVLIDQKRNTVRSRHIYAFLDIDGKARVKRLELVDEHTLQIISDVNFYPIEYRRDEELNDVRILGEIVWSAHDWDNSAGKQQVWSTSEFPN